MISVEDRIRAATRAEADLLREMRPLRLPPGSGTARGPRPGPRARRFKTWTAPATAAAAVIALAVSLVIVKAIPNGRAAPPAPLTSSSSAVPTYYVALPGADNFANVPGATTAVVGDTFTGKRLLTVRPSGKDKFVSVTAAADDRTFVLGANPRLAPPAVPMATAWYLLRLAPGASSVTLSKLRIPAPAPDDLVDATALSPDGTELALAGIQDVLQPINAPQAGAAWVRIYSVATGKLLHSWSTRQAEFTPYTTLSWTADGHHAAIGYTWSGHLGVRMLDVTGQGNDLIADSRLVWSIRTSGTAPAGPRPLSCSVALQALVTPDGKTVVCGASGALRPATAAPFGGPACTAGPPSYDAGFLEYPAGTGKPASTLYKLDTNCVVDGVQALWASGSGDKVAGYIRLGLEPVTKTSTLRFGVFSAGGFTPLPVPPTTTAVPNAIAW